MFLCLQCFLGESPDASAANINTESNISIDTSSVVQAANLGDEFTEIYKQAVETLLALMS